MRIVITLMFASCCFRQGPRNVGNVGTTSAKVQTMHHAGGGAVGYHTVTGGK